LLGFELNLEEALHAPEDRTISPLSSLNPTVHSETAHGPMQRNVVYTCLFGHSETFANHDYQDDSVDYICFTDDETLTSTCWKFIVVENKLIDPHRLSKSFKHLPHRYLGNYERSLYIDNTVKLKIEPSEIFKAFSDDLVVLKHPVRDCVYDEAKAVIDLEYDNPEIVKRQMRFYRDLGYPKHNGLITSTFLLRNHNDEALQAVNEDWHKQILLYSKRDQLSWNVCAHYRNFRYHAIDEKVRNNSLFAWPVSGTRLPRDFDDKTYLSLHPDVRADRINPRKHYLLYGLAEGRPYKRVTPAKKLLWQVRRSRRALRKAGALISRLGTPPGSRPH